MKPTVDVGRPPPQAALFCFTHPDPACFHQPLINTFDPPHQPLSSSLSSQQGPAVSPQPALPAGQHCVLALSVDLAEQELRRRAPGVRAVHEMRGGDDQRARADEVADVAEDLGTVGRVVGDTARVLEVLHAEGGKVSSGIRPLGVVVNSPWYSRTKRRRRSVRGWRR